MIREKYPTLDPGTLEILSKKTAGFYGEELFTVVEEYLKKGYITKKSDYKYRDPISGACPERLTNPFEMKKRLNKIGFRAKILRPRFFPIFPSKLKTFLVNAGTKAITVTHPVSLAASPKYEIIAKKKE